MTLTEYIVFAFSSLFVIVDPIATVPAFWSQRVALFGCIAAIALVAYAILALSARGARWLSPIALRLTTRIMGLLLVAIAMQFFINALDGLNLVDLSSSPSPPAIVP